MRPYTILTWWQRLSQLGDLFWVTEGKSVQIAAASDLEFGNLGVFLDTDELNVLSSGSNKEVLDINDLYWLEYGQLLHVQSQRISGIYQKCFIFIYMMLNFESYHTIMC